MELEGQLKIWIRNDYLRYFKIIFNLHINKDIKL